MIARALDRLYLIVSLIIVSPLIIAALTSIAIGYPFHLITSFIYSKIRVSRR